MAKYSKIEMAVGLGTLIVGATLGVIFGISAETQSKQNKKIEERVYVELDDGSRWNLYDIDHDNSVDFIVNDRSKYGQMPQTEFVAPGYKGKSRWNYSGTKEMTPELRRAATRMFKEKQWFTSQLRRDLREK